MDLQYISSSSDMSDFDARRVKKFKISHSGELPESEANKSAKILGVEFRENMGFEDGFIENNKSNQIEIVKKITAVLNRDFDSSIEFVPDRLGHDFRYSVDAAKLADLGFALDGSERFEENLKETIRYFMDKQKSKEK